MYKIFNKQIIAQGIKRIKLKAEGVARKARPGQFVIIMPDEVSTRVPLKIIESDAKQGTITLVFEDKAPSLGRLSSKQIGESLFSVLGPLGVPSEIKKFGTIVCVGYGSRISHVVSICRALKKADNKVIGVIGAETRKRIIFESQMRVACHKLIVTTDDGSYERKGSVADGLREVMADEKVRLIHAAAPLETLEEISEITRKKRIMLRAHIDPVIIDGTGICRCVNVLANKNELSIETNGPEFDGHLIDFNNLRQQIKRRNVHNIKTYPDRDKPKGNVFQSFVSELLGSEE